MLARAVLALIGVVVLATPDATAEDLAAAIGKRLFERAWVLPPSSTAANDGLGPLFNARSCAACHQRLGRTDMRAGTVPPPPGLVVALVTPDGDGDPHYGRQIQTAAAPGLAPEAEFTLEWREEADGLVAPVPRLTRLADGPLAAQTIASLRVAPALVTIGDVASVPDAALAALADPDDRDGDGISGRLARLGDGRIGRFGWKATTATLAEQTAAAFSTDLGLSSRARPASTGDCTALQTACFAAPQGAVAGQVEIGDEIIGALSAFLRDRHAASPLAQEVEGRGAALFREVGCAACHTPTLPDDKGGVVRIYSDLLLHDLGERLASGGPQGAAQSREWRTAPLRGLGEAQDRGLLHDGRARSIEEAVRWHGGEAQRSQARLLALDAEDRQALMRFLEGL